MELPKQFNIQIISIGPQAEPLLREESRLRNRSSLQEAVEISVTALEPENKVRLINSGSRDAHTKS